MIGIFRHNCITISLHPGTTDTDLSAPFHKTYKLGGGVVFPVEQSVEQMLDVIWGLRLEDSGKVLAYDGSEIPY